MESLLLPEEYFKKQIEWSTVSMTINITGSLLISVDGIM